MTLVLFLADAKLEDVIHVDKWVEWVYLPHASKFGRYNYLSGK